jgi:hypothetical protein
MTGISDALAEIDNLKPGEQLVYTNMQKNMVLIAQRCRARIDLIRSPNA